jgi:uncharacterized membrane protein YfcA
MLASWIGARCTRKIAEIYLRLGFGALLSVVGILIFVTTLRKMKMP